MNGIIILIYTLFDRFRRREKKREREARQKWRVRVMVCQGNGDILYFSFYFLFYDNLRQGN